MKCPKRHQLKLFSTILNKMLNTLLQRLCCRLNLERILTCSFKYIWSRNETAILYIIKKTSETLNVQKLKTRKEQGKKKESVRFEEEIILLVSELC